MSYKKYFFLLFACCLLPCCRDEAVSNKFCNLPANFTFSPVVSIPQLYSSCESQGEWCTIAFDDKTGLVILFTKPDGKEPGKANLTAQANYMGFYMGLAGFIVGLPNIPEVGETVPVVTCYDWACRNCYDDYGTTRRLVLQEGGAAYCGRCQRTYDLNNTGQVRTGAAGQPLYRYRVYYGNNTLSINNR